MVTLQNVSKSFGSVTAVDDVSLSVSAANTLVLIGPSGCGKSTLLRMLAGLTLPDSGHVSVAGQGLEPRTLSAVRRRLGYVIQEGGLFPHLTARQNICLAARFLRWSPERLTTRVDELSRLTRFPSDGLDRFPAQLSGGQQQRVGIMRALMTDPDVLLLDEPLAALDPMVRRDLQDDLRNIFHRLEKTVVVVTHDLHEAAWFADHIVLLRQGRIEQQGTASEFVRHPASEFVTSFVRAQRTSDFGSGE